MRSLRERPGGCAWDLEQSWRSLAPFTLEEAYEVVDAIESGDAQAVREELGDLLFQIVFIAQIAAEQRLFDFNGVARSIADKLRSRHPHIFLDRASSATAPDWETLKAHERAARGAGEGALDGVPRALSALTRADKLNRRAARVGFDFETAAQCVAKVEEELDEIKQALQASQGSASAAVFEEVGDLLLATANLARKLGLDPESALRATNSKFERRFRRMESLAQEQGKVLPALALDEQEALWTQAKLTE